MKVKGRQIMSIYSRPGERIEYVYPQHGHSHDQEKCARLLTVGHTYTVKECRAYDSHSTVELEEIPGELFNTVMFATAV